jgi:hypothetical protein
MVEASEAGREKKGASKRAGSVGRKWAPRGWIWVECYNLHLV